MGSHSIASLEIALEKAVSLRERIDTLNELAMHLLNSDIHRTIHLAEEAKQLSATLKETDAATHKRGIAIANLALGAAYYRHTNNELALSLSYEAVAICENIGELRYMSFGLNTIGATYITLGEYNKALEVHLKSLRIRESIEDQHGAATSLMNIGNVYYLLGDYDKALEYYLQSLTLRKQIGDNTGIGTSLANIGNVYSSIGDGDQALDYLLQSAVMKEATGNKQGLGQTLCDIASEYLKREDKNAALEYARRSYVVSLEIGNKMGQSSALDIIAHIEEVLGNCTEALDYYQQSLDIRRDIEYHKGESESLLAIGHLYATTGKPEQALPILKQSLSLAETLQSKPLMYQAQYALAECYERLEQYHDALIHYKRFHGIKEQIFNEDSSRKVKNLQVLHNLEKAQHEAEIYRLRSVELSAANNEIMRQQNVLAEQAEELQRSNIELLNLNKEKDELLGIVAHDLKNPLTGILINASNIQRNIHKMNVEDILGEMNRIEETTKRMHAIALNLLDVHAIETHAMRLAIQPLNIGEHLKDIADDYTPRAEAKQIAIHISMHTPSILVQADHNALLQVLENLVSNAIKYSPCGKSVYVRSFQTPENMIRIEVEDEGPGIPHNEKEKLFKKYSKLSTRPTCGEESTGLGLSIVKKLTEAMNGRVWCEDAAGHGAVFVIELPAARMPQYLIANSSQRVEREHKYL